MKTASVRETGSKTCYAGTEKLAGSCRAYDRFCGRSALIRRNGCGYFGAFDGAAMTARKDDIGVVDVEFFQRVSDRDRLGRPRDGSPARRDKIGHVDDLSANDVANQ